MSTTDARGHTVPLGSDAPRRQTLLDLSLSIPSVRTCTSLAAANQHVAALRNAGVTASDSSVILVWRTDLAVITAWNGKTWSQVAPPTTTATASGVAQYSPSALVMTKNQGVVTLTGVITTTNHVIDAGWRTDIAVTPTGYRPKQIGGAGAPATSPAVSYVHGAPGTDLYRPDSAVTIAPNGNLSVYVGRRATELFVSMSFQAA